MRKLTFILVLYINSIYSQDKSNELSISGNLKVLFGVENIIIPEDLIIELNPTHHFSKIDSVGNYKFENLESGVYKIQINNFNIKPQQFKVELKKESITNFNIVVFADCELNKKIAEIDIRDNKSKLLLVGSIAPIVYNNQDKFEKKYNIRYYDFGCTPPNEECVIQYNKTIFADLDKKYGKKWRKEVRKDVIGLK